MSELEDCAAWLRKEIEADLAAARIIGAGGFAPQRWDTDPPGQVNPEPVPYRDEIHALLVPDPEDRLLRPDYPGRWVQVVAWDRLNNEPPEADCRDSDLPVMLVDDGRRQADHVIRHDPRNTVADCEAKLAILGEHAPYHMDGGTLHSGAYEPETYCSACGDVPQVPYPCRTIRLLASGYRYRAGHQEGWKP